MAISADVKTAERAPVFKKLYRSKEWVQTARDYIEKNSSVIPITGCWLWMGAFTGAYALAVPSRFFRTDRAHHLSVVAKLGYDWLVPQESRFPRLVVDHLCEHKWCVNPSHLELVTMALNNWRSMQHRKLIAERLRLGLPSGSPVPGMEPSGHLNF